MVRHARSFFDLLAKRLQLNDMEDWYQVRSEDVQMNGGGDLLRKHHSLPSLLQQAYPEHKWFTFKFTRVPVGFWTTRENRLDFMRWLQDQLSIKDMKDWNQLTADHLMKYGGSRMLSLFGNSVYSLLKDTFPTHYWDRDNWSSKRSTVTIDTAEQITDLIRYLESKMKIKALDDWYHVSVQKIDRHIPMASFKKTSLLQCLNTVYPSHVWDTEKLRTLPVRSSQKFLSAIVRELFPSSDVREDHHHETLSKTIMQLDLFLPKENLAFEYQGEGHYHDIYAFGHSWKQKQQDVEKKNRCLELGISLVQIPYWWDLQKSSLAATIRETRKDLLVSYRWKGIPIPTHQQV